MSPHRARFFLDNLLLLITKAIKNCFFVSLILKFGDIP